MQEEYIKILQHGSFQWSFSWKWKHAYLFNIHSLTSQFVSGFVGIEYLLFGRNHLAIFVLVSARYVFSIFYIIFRIYIFAAFVFCVQFVAFCRFLVPFWWIFQHFHPMQLSIFLPFFVSFLASFRCRLPHFFVLLAVFLHSPFRHFVVLF